MGRHKQKRRQIARRAAKASQEISHAIGSCPACGKSAYPSKSAAKAAGRQAAPGVQLRVYVCPEDERWWHQTSQSTQRATVFRDVIVFHLEDVTVIRTEAELARGFIAQVVQGTGAGPTWSELADAMNWPRWILPRLMASLARGGWLSYTHAPRSLRPGDRKEGT